MKIETERLGKYQTKVSESQEIIRRSSMTNNTNSEPEQEETLEIDRSVPSMQSLYDKLTEISQEFERSRELEMRRYKML